MSGHLHYLFIYYGRSVGKRGDLLNACVYFDIELLVGESTADLYVEEGKWFNFILLINFINMSIILLIILIIFIHILLDNSYNIF